MTELCLWPGKLRLIAGCQVNENRAASELAGLAFGLQVLEAWQDQMLLPVAEPDGSKPRPVRIRCCAPLNAPQNFCCVMRGVHRPQQGLTVT